MIAEAARAVITVLLRRIRVGTLTVRENGKHLTFGSGSPAVTLQVHSSRFWARLLRGSRGLAEAYRDGLWNSPDLVGVIRLAARNVDRFDRVRARLAVVRVPVQRVRAVLSSNTRNRSRRDIAAHYDLGNELFSRMLDSTMAYSCAVFEHPEMSLEEASIAKFRRVCEKLELSPQDRLIEIGTGWGGFALHAARNYGCHVTTATISREQREYALAQVRKAGLTDLVDVRLEDYRDLRGRYNKLASIEMIEAVGWQHFGTFFSHCSRLLEPDGAMLLQAITIDDRAYEVEKASRSFMNTHIFPGGCLPSLEVIKRNVARRTDMQLLHIEDLTAHYVETLKRWRQNFVARSEELAQLGYDNRFRRLWSLYLAYCEGGFAERRIRDVQILLAKPRHRLRAVDGRRGRQQATPSPSVST